MLSVLRTLKDYRYLFRQLVRRDFRNKYKKTVLGIFWSALNPLCEFAIMLLVFKELFGRDSPHYSTYLLCGVVVYGMFSGSTHGGMTALLANARIMAKIKVPNWLFVLSKNVSSLVDFGVSFLILIFFMYLDGLTITWRFILLLYPLLCLALFDLGVSMILATMYVFFKDTQYFYGIFCRLLHFLCAIFWRVDRFPEQYRDLFLINPVYDYITYFRTIIIDQQIPDLMMHGLCLGYALFFLFIGWIVYKCNYRKFIYYI